MQDKVSTVYKTLLEHSISETAAEEFVGRVGKARRLSLHLLTTVFLRLVPQQVLLVAE